MSQLKSLWFLLLLSGLFLTGVAYAQEPVDAVSDDDVNRVARELYCPICENTPLDVCETQACEDWRQEIRDRLAAGQSDQEIIEYFAEIYGDRVQATPTNEVSDDDVNRVARELYCPICENTPLDVCETQACEDWRQEIRDRLTAGQSDREIVEYFAEIYGDRARATPTNPVILAAPWVVAAAAGIYFVLLLRRWLARGAEAGSTAVPAPTIRLTKPSEGEPETDNYVARLEREIEESS